MIRAVEAFIDDGGVVHLLESVNLPRSSRAVVLILEEQPLPTAHETTLLSEQALAEDWNRPEEDAAWSHLQPAR